MVDGRVGMGVEFDLLSLLWLVLGFGVALINSVHGEGIFRLGLPVAELAGFDCVAGRPYSELCATLAPLGRWLLLPLNWLWAVLHGQISTPFAAAPSEGWSLLRAIVCGAYWWCVYIFTTRF